MCGERVVELSGDGGREPLQLFGLDNNGCGSSVVTFHQQRWMAAIVGCKERNVGREEGEHRFVYSHLSLYAEVCWHAAGCISIKGYG